MSQKTKVSSTEKKENFIETLMSMSDIEINEFIKTHGKQPKYLSPFVKIDPNNSGTKIKGGTI